MALPKVVLPGDIVTSFASEGDIAAPIKLRVGPGLRQEFKEEHLQVWHAALHSWKNSTHSPTSAS